MIALRIAGAVAIVSVIFSSRAYFLASPQVDAVLPDPIITATVDTGEATGPIELTFRPVVITPGRASRENAFPVTANMNLVRARFVSDANFSIDDAGLERLRTMLRDALQLRLSLAGAQVSPEGWQSAGADLVFRWSVRIPSAGLHHGTIDKKIMTNEFTEPRTSDQIPIRIAVGSIIDEWKDAGGLVAGVFGFLMALGTFYFAWREHLRNERPGQLTD